MESWSPEASSRPRPMLESLAQATSNARVEGAFEGRPSEVVSPLTCLLTFRLKAPAHTGGR